MTENNGTNYGDTMRENMLKEVHEALEFNRATENERKLKELEKERKNRRIAIENSMISIYDKVKALRNGDEEEQKLAQELMDYHLTDRERELERSEEVFQAERAQLIERIKEEKLSNK